jgi:putative DNA methylase
MKPRKKLIEVSIPLEAINAASSKEKSIRHGHPSTLHLWWARRPLAACRAVLFVQLVDDPSAWPDRFGTEAEQDAERRRLHKIIERLVPWEASNDEAILDEARWEIARSIAWNLGEEPPAKGDRKAIVDYLQTKAPPVYDPFCGGGSIPLEAQRLGLRAYGSDLNPVAVLISKGLVEIPPKFAGLPPANPKAQAELKRGGKWNGKGAQGLAEDVRYYGQWMRDEAGQRIGHLYPKAKLADGSEATVIAWLWARTVRSPDPAAKGAMVPLVSSFMLSTKADYKVWVTPVVDASAQHGWRFEVKTGRLSKTEEDRLKLGTKSGKGQAFVCILTGAAIERSYVQSEGKADRLGQRPLAIVGEGARGRLYLSPNRNHEEIAVSAGTLPVVEEARSSFLSPPTPTRAMITGGVCSAYGLRTYGHLFTPRQLVALTTFSDLVGEARELALAGARAAGLPTGDNPLHAGGLGAAAYADAVATYLAFAVDRLADRSSTLCTWDTGAEGKSSTGAPGRSAAIRGTFARQALPMTWDFAEANVFSESAANFLDAVGWVLKPFDFGRIPASGKTGIHALDAARNSYPQRPVVISTDPPYYDNIGYADLSDYFYVWLRRSIADIWPDLFRRLTAPKDAELVATSYRHGGKEEAEAFFMRGMRHALVNMREATFNGEPLAVYYAFKQSEISEEGVTSAGWASFLQSVVDAGLALDGTWPIRTELSSRTISVGANVLASSVVLVCRKRDCAEVVTRAEFIRSLKREMPDAIDDIRKAGVGPVDMQQSVIGPGMGVFTRYAKVLESDDTPMSVKTALSLINRVWEEIENELDANFDPETQVALAWFSTYGNEVRNSGELIAAATPKNLADKDLFESRVFKNLHGKAALMPRDELPLDWSPATEKHPTVWRFVQQTARLLKAEEGGGEAAAKMVAQMGPRAVDAQKLAYRLFEIATRKRLNDEALVYNELAQEWTRLEDLAASASFTPAEAQASLQF